MIAIRTAEAIADTLRIATAGDYEQSLAKLNLSQRQIPIVVRLPESAMARAGWPAPRANPTSGSGWRIGRRWSFCASKCQGPMLNEDFKEFVALLNSNRVEYLIVGGYALAAYGYPRYTGDLDGDSGK